MVECCICGKETKSKHGTYLQKNEYGVRFVWMNAKKKLRNSEAMTYDIKVFEGTEEQETIRNLLQHQVFAIAAVLKRHSIQHLIKSEDGKYWKLENDMLVRIKHEHE